MVVIDVRHGLKVQTRRHTWLASLLGIRHVVLGGEQDDLVDHSQTAFERIASDCSEFATAFGLPRIEPVPVVAVRGDNLVHPSAAMPWYRSVTLLALLEAAPLEAQLLRLLGNSLI